MPKEQEQQEHPLIVKIQILRPNGSVVWQRVGNATRRLDWGAPPDGALITDGELLWGFEYVPDVSPR